MMNRRSMCMGVRVWMFEEEPNPTKVALGRKWSTILSENTGHKAIVLLEKGKQLFLNGTIYLWFLKK